MAGTGSHRIALMCASLASGPFYLVACVAGSMIQSVSQLIIISAQDLVNYLPLLVLVTAAGFFLSVVPLGLAILILSGMASSSVVPRRPVFWAGAGAGAGALIVWAAGWDGSSGSFAFVCSASASLRLARSYLAWPPPEPLFLPRAGIVGGEIATPH
jgi:hypothetical protein